MEFSTVRAYLDALRRCVERGPFQTEARELQGELLDDQDDTVHDRLQWIHTRPGSPFERYLRVKATVAALKEEPVRRPS